MLDPQLELLLLQDQKMAEKNDYIPAATKLVVRNLPPNAPPDVLEFFLRGREADVLHSALYPGRRRRNAVRHAVALVEFRGADAADAFIAAFHGHELISSDGLKYVLAVDRAANPHVAARSMQATDPLDSTVESSPAYESFFASLSSDSSSSSAPAAAAPVREARLLQELLGRAAAAKSGSAASAAPATPAPASSSPSGARGGKTQARGGGGGRAQRSKRPSATGAAVSAGASAADVAVLRRPAAADDSK